MDIVETIKNANSCILKEIAKCVLWKTGDNLITNIQIYKKPSKMSNAEYCKIVYDELRKRNINPWQK